MTFDWKSESDDAAPTEVAVIDDRTRADDALRRVSRGEYLEYAGTFANAKQLLSAMARRLPAPRQAKSALEAFRAERRSRSLEHETLSRLVVRLDRGYRLKMAGAPDVSRACADVWGPATADATLVPLKTLLGMLGAAEWRRKGLAVPGLEGLLTPHYGVYTPTRSEYVELLSRLPDVKGRTVFDIGTGTGVLSFVLLQRGASRATATDIDARAVRCATENAEQLGLSARFEAREQPLFPSGRADIVVCNPPWIPEPPKNRIDRAVFDDQSSMLRAFVSGLAEHLTPEGRGVLLLSNLAVELGLREETWLAEALAAGGLRVVDERTTTARHGKAKDKSDVLHAARSKERTTMYVLRDMTGEG